MLVSRGRYISGFTYFKFLIVLILLGCEPIPRAFQFRNLRETTKKGGDIHLL